MERKRAVYCVALHYVVVCRFFADKGANRRYLLLVLAWLWDLQMRVFFSWEGKGGGDVLGFGRSSRRWGVFFTGCVEHRDGLLDVYR